MEPSQRFRGDHSDLLRKPLVGDDGVNPFADPNAPPGGEEADANIYASPGQTDGQPIQTPPEYVATLVAHSRRILVFGVAGLVVSLICLPLFYYLPLLALANHVLTIGACVMGYVELKGMAAGVVVDGDQKSVIAGTVMGLIGTLLNLTAIGLFIYFGLFLGGA